MTLSTPTVVVVSGGPFDLYPVTPEALTGAADTVFATAEPLVDAGRSAHWRSTVAEWQTEGVIDGLIEAIGGDSRAAFQDCAELAVLGAGAVNRWSSSVRTFNTGVDELNAEYATARANSFGLEAPTPSGGTTPDSYEGALDQHRDQVAAADAALLVELRRRYGVLESTLDTEATSVAGLLDRGPSQQVLLDLFQSGALPLTVTGVLPGMPFDQTPRGQDAAVDQALAALREDGRLDGEPDDLYREWVTTLVASGMSTSQIRNRAEQEEVDSDTFDDLQDLEIMRDPQGRPFVLLEDDEGAKNIARLVELLNGGEPSETDTRRSNNEWTYDGWLMSPSDVEFVLDNDGAIVATPEGTLMAAPGPDGLLPNPVDLFSSRGGTTWMEMFVVNGSHDDPAAHLRGIIERGSLDESGYSPDDLERLLRHERIHTEQWAEYGYWSFIARYLAEGTNPCENSFEEEAGHEDGGYSCN